MDQRQEDALGQSVSLAATNQYGVIKNERLASYVVLVGQTVASRTQRADQNWVFGVLDTDKVNAFSGPNGYVWITRGAIEQMQDESELAGVLAHEVGHVVKQHGLNMAKTAAVREGLMETADSFSNVGKFSQLSDTVSTGIMDTGFSQPQEYEADEVGVKYVIAAGYNPNGYLNFLKLHRCRAEIGRRWIHHAPRHGRPHQESRRGDFIIGSQRRGDVEGSLRPVHQQDRGWIDRPGSVSCGSMPRVLFLCTANYYRSRFAELLFNQLASQIAPEWSAFSRALAIEENWCNDGPISQHTRNACRLRSIDLPEPICEPAGVTDADFEAADRVIAVKEAEHRRYVEQRHPKRIGVRRVLARA